MKQTKECFCAGALLTDIHSELKQLFDGSFEDRLRTVYGDEEALYSIVGGTLRLAERCGHSVSLQSRRRLRDAEMRNDAYAYAKAAISATGVASNAECSHIFDPLSISVKDLQTGETTRTRARL